MGLRQRNLDVRIECYENARVNSHAYTIAQNESALNHASNNRNLVFPFY